MPLLTVARRSVRAEFSREGDAAPWWSQEFHFPVSGVMAPGDYEFGTSQHETLTVLSGALTVKLPGQSDWQQFHAGQSFEVAAEQKFQLKVTQDTAYLCTYA